MVDDLGHGRPVVYTVAGHHSRGRSQMGVQLIENGILARVAVSSAEERRPH